MEPKSEAELREYHDRTVEKLTRLVLTHCKKEKVSTASACLCLLSVIGGLAGSMRVQQPERADESDALLRAMETGFPRVLKAIRAVKQSS